MIPLHDTAVAMAYTTQNNCVESINTVLDILNNVFGYQSFRSGQQEVVECLLQDRDCLVIIPTGGGKTVCYCVSGPANKGVTVVVGPLLSLINDQIQRLRSKGIKPPSLTQN